MKIEIDTEKAASAVAALNALREGDGAALKRAVNDYADINAAHVIAGAREFVESDKAAPVRALVAGADVVMGGLLSRAWDGVKDKILPAVDVVERRGAPAPAQPKPPPKITVTVLPRKASPSRR